MVMPDPVMPQKATDDTFGAGAEAVTKVKFADVARAPAALFEKTAKL
jgi:hypothetical protein